LSGGMAQNNWGEHRSLWERGDPRELVSSNQRMAIALRRYSAYAYGTFTPFCMRESDLAVW